MNEKIKLLLEEGIKYSQNDFKDWMELKLERALTTEESTLVKEHLLKAQILSILQKDVKYLSVEEIIHKINFLAQGQISIPTLLNLVSAWEKLPYGETTDEAKIKEIIEKFLT